MGKDIRETKLLGLTLDTSLNIGTLMTLGGCLITVIVGYTNIKNNIETLDKFGGEAHYREVNSRQEKDNMHDKAISSLITNDEKFLEKLQSIKERLDRMERN